MSEHGDIEAGEIKPMELHICKFGQDATLSPMKLRNFYLKRGGQSGWLRQ